MRKYTLKVAVLGFLGIGFGVFAQTGKMGINTETPNATLDVVAKKGEGGSDGIDGFKAPQLTGEELKTMSANLTENHDGLIVYVTSAVATPDDKTQKVTFPGYYRYTHSRNLGGLSEANGQLPNFLYAEASWVRLEATGLEVIRNPKDYTKVGRRLVGANADNHGGIGLLAVDMSYQDGTIQNGGTTGEQSFAIGKNTTASGTKSFAMGENTIAEGAGSLAGGIGTHAQTTGSFVYGSNNKILGNFAGYATAFGENVLIGKRASNDNNYEDSSTFGNSRNSLAVGEGINLFKAPNSLAYGENTVIDTSSNSFVGGTSSKIISSNSSVALGDTNVIDSSQGSLALGSNISITNSLNSIAIGNKVKILAQNGVAIGNNSEVSGQGGLALGSESNVFGSNGVAIGGGKVNGDSGVAIGVGAVAGADEVAIGGTTQTVTLGKLTPTVIPADYSCTDGGKLAYSTNVGFFICTKTETDSTLKWRKLNN